MTKETDYSNKMQYINVKLHAWLSFYSWSAVEQKVYWVIALVSNTNNLWVSC